MKKQALSVVCALMAVLCACSQSPALDAESHLHTAASETLQQTPSNDLRLLSSESESGRYFLSETGGGRLFSYVDYAKAVEMPLCTSVACAHNSESCTAWSPLEDNVTCPVFINKNTMAFIHVTEKGNQTVESMPVGGGERKVIFSAKDGQFIETLLCADNTAFYFIANETASEESKWWLYQAQIDGSDVKPLREIPELMVEFKGTEGRNLVCYQYKWANVPENEPTSGSHRLFLWNLDTGDEQVMDEWESLEGSSGRSLLWKEGKIYWCSYDKPDALYWKAPDNSTGEIPIAWPDEILNAAETTFVLDDIVQGHALLTVWGPWGADSLKRYAVVLDSPDSAPIEIPLRYVSNASEKPVAILGKTDGQLLVQFEEQTSFVTRLNDDGSASKYLEMKDQYGLITWEDFLAGKPNYREISAQSVA